MGRIKAEYIWMDGHKPTSKLRSKTKIIDVTGSKPVYLKGYVPKKSVVIPGTEPKTFNARSFNVPCELIIGKRKESTNKKTSLNDALRDYNVSV